MTTKAKQPKLAICPPGMSSLVPAAPTEEPAVQAPESAFCSQDYFARIFTELHAHEFLYVGKIDKWYHYDGSRWQEEKTLLVWDIIRTLLRDQSRALVNDEGKKLLHASTIAGCERLARTDRAHTATIDQWDADPWLLNTPDGVVDLQTGALGKHDPLLFMTKMCSVSPRAIPTPVFDRFMARVQPDAEVRDYLNRRSGYGLTGATREHMLAFDYGTGRNGKGVHQQIQLEIMGDYATTAPMELLVESQFDRHPTEIARLVGMRAVGLSETEGGRRWNESRIKTMTGGDRLQGRFMRQDFFEFMPQFKLFILGNHMPALRNIDEAMSSRLQFVRWGVTIPKEERDQRLIEKLRPEYPGILYQWIQGCLEWQRDGLRPPSAVNETTANYLKNEDALGRWIDESDRSNSQSFSSNEELFQSWCAWCESQGEFAGRKIKFTKNLEDRGFKRDTVNNERGFHGITGPLPPLLKLQKERPAEEIRL